MVEKRKSGFTPNTIQTLLSVLLVIGLIFLSVLSLTSSNKSLKLSIASQNAISQLEVAVEVRREIFLYDVAFGLWSTGHTPLSAVMSARATLLQSLGVSEGSARSISQIGNSRLAGLIQGADQLFAKAGPNYLSIKLQDQFLESSLRILNGLTSVAKIFAVPYAAVVDSQIYSSSNSQRSSARYSLIRFLIWLALVVPLVFWIGTTARRKYKNARVEALLSQENLDQVREELTVAHETVLALQKINESETDFVATLNHELRTPLTSIIGYLDILKNFTAVEDDREFHKYLGVMDRNAVVLYDLIESILFLSALDNQQTVGDPALVDLVDICEASVADQVLAIKSAHLKVRIDYREGEYYSVLGNKTLLTQVFTNLISNAIKFSPERSRIDITFTRYVDDDGKELIRVEVKDQGCGIPVADLPHLFTRFFRASNALGSEIPGTGLGLTIVNRIIELHQGSVSVISKVGEGTSMIVELPFTISPLEELIMGKRQQVLERAIASISKGPDEKLMEITHDLGGAIGFYTYAKESEKLIAFSRWLEKNPDAGGGAVAKKKEVVLELLQQTLGEVIDGGVAHGK